jgi:hypothetical protein
MDANSNGYHVPPQDIQVQKTQKLEAIDYISMKVVIVCMFRANATYGLFHSLFTETAKEFS